MASKDTIVGISGAVLLAALMVGVFVYEYNNPPADTSSDGQLQAAFRSAYPHLNATADLDGNGVPNYRDADIDGDGVANGDDPDTAVTLRFTGTMPAPTPPATTAAAQEFRFRVEPGLAGATFTLYYNSSVPAPLAQVPRAPTLEVSVIGPDGTASGAPQTSQTGTAVTSTVTASLAPGDYTIRVTETVGGPATPFAVKAVLDYGAGQPGATHGPGH